MPPPLSGKNKMKFKGKNKKIKNGPVPTNSGPNPQPFWFLVGGTLGHRRAVLSSLDEILAA